VTHGGPGISVCESSVFLPTALYALWLSVGAGLLSNLFSRLAIKTHKRESGILFQEKLLEFPVYEFPVRLHSKLGTRATFAEKEYHFCMGIVAINLLTDATLLFLLLLSLSLILTRNHQPFLSVS